MKRKFASRLKEHQKTVEHKHPQKSAFAEHCLCFGHSISWESSKILLTSANWRNRRRLEAWEINVFLQKFAQPGVFVFNFKGQDLVRSNLQFF